MQGIIPPAPISFHGVGLSEAHGRSLYCNTVVSISICIVLGTYTIGVHDHLHILLYKLVGTELLQLTV